jgi:hypothetical protein
MKVEVRETGRIGHVITHVGDRFFVRMTRGRRTDVVEFKRKELREVYGQKAKVKGTHV